MAYILANKDGTSNAKIGDIVVTGGGLFKKNDDGSVSRVGSLNTPTGKTGSYDEVVNAFYKITSGIVSSPAPTYQAPSVEQKPSGIVELKPDPLFDPNEFTTSGSPIYGTVNSNNSTASSGLNKIVGYFVVGLVGIALLDRFVNSKK